MVKANERLAVRLGTLPLGNPIIPASGTFGFGKEYLDYYDINILGSFCTKGTTKEPRQGNPTPRVAETPAGMLNAVGLQNPGIDVVISRELEEMKQYFHKPVVANISGFSVEEYAHCCRKLDGCDNVGIIEVNISCPNVHGGGIAFGQSATAAAEVTRAARAATTKPVYIKLSPNVTDIAEIALACEEAGADGISLINTLLGLRIDLAARKPLLANRTGGLSGPAVLPVALRMVYDVAKAVRIPIIGMGGVTTARDVVEMMMAGAAAVQVGTQNLINPLACKEIIEELPQVMDELRIQRLADIIGCAL